VRRNGVHDLHHLADFYAEAVPDGGKAVHWARRDNALRENFCTQAARCLGRARGITPRLSRFHVHR
jgi:hypothetical protein